MANSIKYSLWGSIIYHIFYHLPTNQYEYYDTIRKIICKRSLTDQYPLRECRAASSQKSTRAKTYIDETKVLGIKQVSFEFRSEDCGRQIFVFQVCWECVPCSRSRDRKPTRAESLGECSRYEEITTSCRTMRLQRITVWNKREHLREVWRGFTAQAAENKQTKFERDSLPDRKPV